jgi:hypothetical protein
MKRIISCLFVVVMLAFAMIGCAGFLQWSPEAQTKLDTFGVWADKYIGGAMNEAPLLIKIAEGFVGSTPETKAASLAVDSAKEALGVYHAAVVIGSATDIATKEADLLKAVDQVNSTVGTVKAIIKAVDGASVATLAVPTQ